MLYLRGQEFRAAAAVVPGPPFKKRRRHDALRGGSCTREGFAAVKRCAGRKGEKAGFPIRMGMRAPLLFDGRPAAEFILGWAVHSDCTKQLPGFDAVLLT